MNREKFVDNLFLNSRLISAKILARLFILDYNKSNNFSEGQGSEMILDKGKQTTQVFSKVDMNDDGTRAILLEVYKALIEKGYDPINQIVGYILSEDPTYITNYNGARGLIRKIDRDKLLNTLVKNYLGVE